MLDAIRQHVAREAVETMTDRIDHAPEDWGTEYCGKDTIKVFKISDKRRIATIKVKSSKLDEANAKRIVQCVNACKGINPEAVPEMLNALKEIASKRVYDGWIDRGDKFQYGYATARKKDIATARAAIAKAKG